MLLKDVSLINGTQSLGYNHHAQQVGVERQ